MFALFRDPIDMEVSKFYYLQKATWEPTYNERWKNMTFERWASRERGSNNWVTRLLVGKTKMDGTVPLTDEDLELAKDILRTKFVIGLMDQFEDSVHRFNLMLGIDESDPQNQQCIAEFSSGRGDDHAKESAKTITEKNVYNSYSHPKAEKGSPAWTSLAKIHSYDTALYQYITELYAAQGPMFETSPVGRTSIE
jgi:hypothetical protein